MKFLYEYRTPDNALHEGVAFASSREVVYAQLKSQGIRPSRVTEAPGFFNKFFGKGKRWIAIALLSIALVATLFVIFRLSSNPDSIERCQVYGDPEVLRQYEETNWEGVFNLEGNRILAAFAQPGRAIPFQYMLPARGAKDFFEFYGAKLAATLSKGEPTSLEDTEEAHTMRLIVAGMREELREYLEAGGTAALYMKRLVARQTEEARLRVRAANEVKASRPENRAHILKERNAELRTMGILPILGAKNNKNN